MTKTLKQRWIVNARIEPDKGGVVSTNGTEKVDWSETFLDDYSGEEPCRAAGTGTLFKKQPYHWKTEKGSQANGSGPVEASVSINSELKTFSVTIEPAFEYDLTMTNRTNVYQQSCNAVESQDNSNTFKYKPGTVYMLQMPLDTANPDGIHGTKTITEREDSFTTTTIYTWDLARCRFSGK